ncbi:MAG TPA: response regulator [Pirellulaceae bacterium]|nr:response regulator [Pirellulaceae bacterium]
MNMSTDYRNFGVLYVDDEPQALKYFDKLFADQFRVFTAQSAEIARGVLQREGDQIAVLVTDQRMPGETGVNLLEYARIHHPTVIRIITTAYSDLESAIAAVNSGGIYQYIAKPWKMAEFSAVIQRAIEFYEVRQQRDQLLGQKLSVLQGVLILDRVRSMAAVAASYEGLLRRPFAALRAYVENAKRIEIEAFSQDELLSLDMWTIARSEGQFLVETVRNVQGNLRYIGDPVQEYAIATVVEEAVSAVLAQRQDEGVRIEVHDESQNLVVTCQKKGVVQCLSILLHRLFDLDGEDVVVDITIRQDPPSAVAIELKPRNRRWTVKQISALFSGVISKRNWLMGLDMDLLAAFFIAYDQGGEMVLSLSNEEPALLLRLGLSKDPIPDIGSAWLDEAFQSTMTTLALPSAD